MANLKLKLTHEQQKQIEQATGKNISEIEIRSTPGELSDTELQKVSGGAVDAFIKIDGVSGS